MKNIYYQQKAFNNTGSELQKLSLFKKASTTPYLEIFDIPVFVL
jgi:hypothetical protein